MKKLLIVAMCFAFAGVVQPQNAWAQNQEAAKKSANGPKFEFKGGDTYDFGSVPEGPSAEHIFEFKNTGKEPLIIQQANASCGCTTPEWPKEPILPGKTGKISVKFNTTGRGGQPFDKTVFISSNAVTEKERYELHIKGTVVKAEENK